MARKQKRSVEGVLFDWDGTLLDSYDADASAYMAMFKEMGISWGLAELAKNYSPDGYYIYRAAGLPRKRWKEADRAWRLHYLEHKPKLIPGARRVLARLDAAHRLGLVTSGDRDRVRRQLREFRLTGLFATPVCSGDTLLKKPHPEPLRLALRQMGLAPSACVYVGDTPQDVQMAQRAGVCAIGVLGPFPTAERLRAARPEFLLSSIGELPNLLARLGA